MIPFSKASKTSQSSNKANEKYTNVSLYKENCNITEMNLGLNKGKSTSYVQKNHCELSLRRLEFCCARGVTSPH